MLSLALRVRSPSITNPLYNISTLFNKTPPSSHQFPARARTFTKTTKHDRTDHEGRGFRGTESRPTEHACKFDRISNILRLLYHNLPPCTNTFVYPNLSLHPYPCTDEHHLVSKELAEGEEDDYFDVLEEVDDEILRSVEEDVNFIATHKNRRKELLKRRQGDGPIHATQIHPTDKVTEDIFHERKNWVNSTDQSNLKPQKSKITTSNTKQDQLEKFVAHDESARADRETGENYVNPTALQKKKSEI